MASTSWTLITGGINTANRKGFLDKGSVLCFDAIPELTTDLTAKVSSYPVEDGADISDHIQNQNDKYTITAYITNTPLMNYKNNAVLYGSEGKRVGLAIEVLRGIKENRVPITLVNEFEVLKDCVVTDVSWTQTPQESEAIGFRITFEKIRRATAKRVSINVKSNVNGKAANKSTASNKSGGDAAKKEAPNTYVGQLKAAREAESAKPKFPTE